ncbi:MAG: class I SAM-dependent methyltransferase [Lentisphaeria bacterium]|nr:class I SAM-dependent methyltransferase [Lentisphaeria bacterium]
MSHEDSPLDLSFSAAPRLTFPEDAWEWFKTACSDIELPLDDTKRPILEALYSHLVHVNETLNLTRITSPLDYLKFHVFDSLTIENLVAAYTKPDDIVVDLGSGGGYPGLPLMTWLPDRHWALVDSRPHKVDFLNETLKLTPAAENAHAFAFRGREAASQAPKLFQNCKLVIARAVGRGAELLQDVTALLDVNGIFILMKGPAYPQNEQPEFLRALPAANFDLLEEQNIALDETDPDRWVIVTTKLKALKQKKINNKGKFRSSEKRHGRRPEK